MDPITIFVCYARDDGRWVDPKSKDKLIPWLAQALRRENVEFWVDRRIDGGDEWRLQIESAIDRAKIAILLVDQPFLSSEFIETVELPRIQSRANRGEMVVMPILTKPCKWEKNPFIESRQLLPMFPQEVTPLPRR